MIHAKSWRCVHACVWPLAGERWHRGYGSPGDRRNGDAMIRLRTGGADLERMRFAYSPLTEVAETLYMLHSGQIHPVHHGWFDWARADVRRADTGLLGAVVPRGYLPSFFPCGAIDATTTIEQQHRPPPSRITGRGARSRQEREGRGWSRR